MEFLRNLGWFTKTLCTTVGGAVLVWYGIHYSKRIATLLLRKRENDQNERKGRKIDWIKNLSFLAKHNNQFPVFWSRLPSIEQTEWLNKCIIQVWPFLSGVMLTILKEKVEPEIQNFMPYMLKSFHFLDVDLGDEPIQIQRVHVHTTNVEDDELLVDIDIVYKGGALVQAGFNPAGTLGISLKEIRGTFRVELKSLVPRPPLISAVFLAFLESPHLEFDLTNLLNVIDVTGLHSYVKNAIVNVIDGFIVLPNRYFIPMADDEDATSSVDSLPLGVLQIFDISATDPKFLDGTNEKVDVKVKLGNYEEHTSLISLQESLHWTGEVLNLLVDQVADRNLCFEVQSKHSENGIYGVLAQVEQDLSEICSDEGLIVKECSIPLEDNKGLLNCQYTWCHFNGDDPKLGTKYGEIQKNKNNNTDYNNENKSSIPSSPPSSLPTCLSIKLEYATDLPQLSTNDTDGIFVLLTVKSKTMKSKTKRKTKNPIWNETHHLLVQDIEEGSVKFEVRTEQRDDLIGCFMVELSEIADVRPVRRLAKHFQLQECITDSYLRVTLDLKKLIR